MVDRRTVLMGLLVPLIAVPVVVRASVGAREWVSFTEAGVEMTAFRKGELIVGPDGRCWIAGLMPNGRCGLRAA